MDSVGIVEPQVLELKQPIKLKSGGELPAATIVYETYGKLNPQRSNAVLICHALSGDHHAAGYHNENEAKPGWWDNLIGPGKAVDTDKFYVVALNNIGGCSGSSGPTSMNPATGKLYGGDFPQVVVEDWVRTQLLLSDELGIDCWAAVMGGSLGGMQALQWAISYPQRLRAAVLIAATAQLSPQNIAFNEIARQAILKDPEFRQGNYSLAATSPTHGLWLARMLGHTTYLSEEVMLQKFGRRRSPASTLETSSGYEAMRFEVENYLNYQGQKFAKTFDANTYLLMTRALDYFDPAAEYAGDLAQAVAQTDCSFLVVSFSTDWRFSAKNSRQLVAALIRAGKRVCYTEIESVQGHDSFLMPLPRYLDTVSRFLTNLAQTL